MGPIFFSEEDQVVTRWFLFVTIERVVVELTYLSLVFRVTLTAGFNGAQRGSMASRLISCSSE